jgi:hypothetical protein
MKHIEWDWHPGVTKFSIAQSNIPAANNRLHLTPIHLTMETSSMISVQRKRKLGSKIVVS